MDQILSGIQGPILERFRRHIRAIPHGLAGILETMIEDTAVDYGARQLLLELVPAMEHGCPLKLYVNESFCEGTIGRFGSFVMIPRGSSERDEVREYPERVEVFIRLAVYGFVEEEAWHWRGRLLRGVTWAVADGIRSEIASTSGGLWWVHRLLAGVTREQWHYRPYCGEGSG